MILSLLGFAAACSGEDDPGMVEYGTPHVTFSLKGKVTDSAGKPIPGIEVGFEDSYNPAYTDSDGRFVFADGAMWPFDEAEPQTLYFKDVDGAENGSFDNATADVVFTKVGEGSGWSYGRYAAPDVEIEMKESAAE